jgi:hypothetical protein
MSSLEKFSLLSFISLDSLSSFVGSLEIISSHLVESNFLKSLLSLGVNLSISIDSFNFTTFRELVSSISIVNESSKLIHTALSVLLSLVSGHVKSISHLLSLDLVSDSHDVGILYHVIC